MSHSLAAPLHRIAWMLAVAAAVVLLFLLLDRSSSQFGIDFIVYVEPDSVAADRRLPQADRGNPEFAIRTVQTFQQAIDRSPTVLMVHGDARGELDFDAIRTEFQRGLVVIAVDMTPDDLAPLIDPGIASVATVTEPLRAPFYTLLAKGEEQCPQGLRPGCGVFVADGRTFSGFEDLTAHARQALDVLLRAMLTPTATPPAS